MTPAPRLVLIGLDAADRAFIAQHAALVPNVARILRDGVVGELAAEALPGAVWPSFCTGSHPADHGIYHHMQWDPGCMRIRRMTGDWLSPRPFWRDLGERGVRVTAFDVPFVFPGPSRNVLEVMNWGTHDNIASYWANDAALGRRIRREFGLSPMGFEITVDKTRAQLESYRDGMVAAAAVKGRLATWLMRERPWDVFITAFGETHRGGHTLWPYPDADATDATPSQALEQVYAAVDRAVGAIVREAGDAADVVLFALHGMGPNSSQSHLTSAFMRRAIARFKDEPLPPDAGDVPGVFRTLRRVVPGQLQLAVATRVPRFVRDRVVAREIGGGYDWPTTLGFCLHGDLAGYLRLNLAGRERAGVVTDDGAAALRRFLRAELEALTVDGGRSPVQRVSFPAYDWAGPRAHLLPDVLVEWDPEMRPADALHSPTLGAIRSRIGTGRGGNHLFNGFYAHRGPRQAAGVRPPRHIAEIGAFAAALA
jgi:predicted AlkP superfamily phosphohydrolase/phosphomutase